MIGIFFLLLSSAIGSPLMCLNDSFCEREYYCKPLLFKESGECTSCEFCCSGYYSSACNTRCRCGQFDGFCITPWDCGEGGMFCNKASGACESCIDCVNDELSDCKYQCNSIVYKDTFERIDRAKEYFKALFIKHHNQLWLESIDNICPKTTNAFITQISCPCIASDNSLLWRCPIGTTCIPTYKRIAINEYAFDQFSGYANGICVKCDEGRLCDKTGMIGMPPLCPAGYICNGTHKFSCDKGTFCYPGSAKAKTC